MYDILNKMIEKATNEALTNFINSLHDQLDEELEKRTTEDKKYDFILGAQTILEKIGNFIIIINKRNKK